MCGFEWQAVDVIDPDRHSHHPRTDHSQEPALRSVCVDDLWSQSMPDAHESPQRAHIRPWGDGPRHWDLNCWDPLRAREDRQIGAWRRDCHQLPPVGPKELTLPREEHQGFWHSRYVDYRSFTHTVR